MTKHIVIDARTRPSSTGRYIDRLLEHLQVLDSVNKYTVLIRPGDNWKPDSKNFIAIPCKYRQFSFNPIDQISFARFLYRLKPDLVHFGMSPQEPIFYFKNRVTTLHDLTMLRFARAGRLPKIIHFIRMIGYRMLLKASLRMAKEVIVPTEFVKDEVVRYVPLNARKVTVTLEASEQPIKIPAKAIENINKPFILYVGSAFPHKNLESLIKAYAELRQTNPELNLVLAGKKEYYYKKLEAMVGKQHALKNKVIFTGFVGDAELKWLYEHAEAYVFPSLSEGFGLPGLEAMVHGCPVVSSNATCLPEVYGDSAHYFDPEDTKDIATKILDVISNKKLRESLIKKGYKQAAKYSWKKTAQQTLEVYKRVLEKD